MKTLIEKIIKKRNPKFTFDSAITNRMIGSLMIEKTIALLRSAKLLFRGKRTNLLFLGKSVKIQYLNKVDIGKLVNINESVTIKALGKGKVTIGNNVGIGAYSRLIVSTSFNNLGKHITIGNNVGLGEFAYLGGAGGLTIGDDCIIGQYFSCHPENHNFENQEKLIRNQGTTRKGIVIGKNCWIGAKVTILDGVEIGSNCVIAAGSVVTKSMIADSVIGGVPAKIIKHIESKFDENKKKGIKTIYLKDQYTTYTKKSNISFFTDRNIVCNAD